jgi:hypothetical protein
LQIITISEIASEASAAGHLLPLFFVSGAAQQDNPMIMSGFR